MQRVQTTEYAMFSDCWEAIWLSQTTAAVKFERSICSNDVTTSKMSQHRPVLSDRIGYSGDVPYMQPAA
jgi:hypothetical protein